MDRKNEINMRRGRNERERLGRKREEMEVEGGQRRQKREEHKGGVIINSSKCVIKGILEGRRRNYI